MRDATGEQQLKLTRPAHQGKVARFSQDYRPASGPIPLTKPVDVYQVCLPSCWEKSNQGESCPLRTRLSPSEWANTTGKSQSKFTWYVYPHAEQILSCTQRKIPVFSLFPPQNLELYQVGTFLLVKYKHCMPQKIPVFSAGLCRCNQSSSKWAPSYR